MRHAQRSYFFRQSLSYWATSAARFKAVLGGLSSKDSIVMAYVFGIAHGGMAQHTFSSAAQR
jgi:hypothetical protein